MGGYAKLLEQLHCPCVLSHEDRCGALDCSGLESFQIDESTLGMHCLCIVHCRAPQASTGIPAGWVLHGLKMTSQLLVAERRLLGDVNPSQHTQFSELKSICSNPTSLCSSTGLPQIVMTLTVSGGILSRVSHCSVLTLYYTQTPMVMYEVPNVHGRPQNWVYVKLLPVGFVV